MYRCHYCHLNFSNKLEFRDHDLKCGSHNTCSRCNLHVRGELRPYGYQVLCVDCLEEEERVDRIENYKADGSRRNRGEE